jgi:phenylacetate-coenzyme A ligase PaaK-like adenylate-forming protein
MRSDIQLFDDSAHGFEAVALEVFQYQFNNNSFYRRFCELQHKSPETVTTIQDIPFLPIEFFKQQTIYSFSQEPEIIFTSSGTTGSITSRHPVAKLSLYQESFLRAFRHFYGDEKEWTILALLPSYLEREGSSLVVMADELIRRSKHEESGFYLRNYSELAQQLTALSQQPERKVLLLGVTYALLDLAEQFPQPLQHIVVMETGGMKGKRKEMVREELHHTLKTAFNIPAIHSEYGMTELLSQVYSKGNGIFETPPWMRILIREMNDPLTYVEQGKTGGINIIDLANKYSCSFLATSDLGKQHNQNQFEILGRFDFSDVRGCNLMVE